MKKKKVTSMEVARLAGVSQPTVSMILNKKYNVSFSKETIEKVEWAAKELGYSTKRKNKEGRKLRKTIFVLCPTLNNPYYPMLIQGIEKSAKENKYDIFICNTRRSRETERKYLEKIEALGPSGIIYTCTPSFDEEVRNLARKIPVVIIGDRRGELEIDGVELNSRKPGSMIARYLIEMGHRKVAFVTTSLTARQPARIRRVEGFCEEFRAIHCGDGVIVKALSAEMDEMLPDIDTEYKTGYDLTKEILKEYPTITAVVGLNDTVALGIMDALKDEKYKIPEDMTVIGCDNTLASRLRGVELTTVEHYIPLKGRDACEIIIKKIGELKKQKTEMSFTGIHHIEYNPRLIIRGSSGYPREY